MDDTQHTLHGESYAYSTPGPYYAEFYDLWVETLFTPTDNDNSNFEAKPRPFPDVEDVPIFTALLEEQVRESKVGATAGWVSGDEESVVNVVDMGTGTGRVVWELSWHCRTKGEEEEGMKKVCFWGVDHSQSMLKRAEEVFSSSSTIPPSTPKWIHASATEFVDALVCGDGKGGLEGQIGLLVFSAGGIHHLVSREELERFLDEVARGLVINGVAVLSVLEDMVPPAGGGSTSTEKPGEGVGKEEIEYDAPLRIPSRRFPGAVYTKTQTGVVWDQKGRVRTDRFVVELKREGKKGGGEVVWKREMEWSLRMWDHEEFMEMVEKKGLRVREVRMGEGQRWYLLERRRE